MRLVAPQVGLHQRVGNEPGILHRNAGTLVNGGGEVAQALGIDASGRIHRNS
jgi:hypothetical protein